MTKNEMLNLFHRTILNDSQSATKLVSLLESARGACIQMDGNQLQKVNDEIIHLIDGLQKNHHRRLKVVNAFGFSQNAEAFVASLPNKIKVEVSAKLNALKALLKKCEQKNQGNGELFSEQHELVNQLSEASITIRI